MDVFGVGWVADDVAYGGGVEGEGDCEGGGGEDYEGACGDVGDG